ncbi:hypothetical protein PVAND_015600 [Polypedilum vanderplanki]|uniref:Uncharacterized protein n=1 Tax=Polypedilum vanderplanki TaxID=319348 RepID=A0A9J6BD44_POLVA|nr:hypothetical protein PVAND_015600 [Polypedilum vanderplanki]
MNKVIAIFITITVSVNCSSRQQLLEVFYSTLHAALLEEYPNDEQRVICMMKKYREMNVDNNFFGFGVTLKVNQNLQQNIKEIEQICANAGVHNATFFIIIISFSLLVVVTCFGFYHFLKRK